MDRKILGLIPARSGSKGIPGKNIKPLGGTPLICYSIEGARNSGSLDRILVDTDDPAIAEVARNSGAEVPWLRPPELATDKASVVEVVKHSLKRLEADAGYQPGGVMLLQPTSPFRTPSTIQRAVDLFLETKGESVISVSEAKEHPYWCKKIDGKGILQDYIPNTKMPARRQELPEVFRLNGAVYLASVETIMKKNSFYSSQTRGLIMSREEGLDLDEPMDWEMAEYFLAQRKSPQK